MSQKTSTLTLWGALVCATLSVGLSAQAQEQSSKTSLKPAAQEDDSASSEAAQFSGADVEGGPSFYLFGKKWTPSAFNVSSVESDKIPKGGRLGTYSYLTFATWAGDNLRFKVRVPFTYSTAGTDRKNSDKPNREELALQDIILELSSSNFLLIPFDVGIYWAGRIYLPNSKHSQQAGQVAHFRNEVILNKNFSRTWALEYQQQLGYYHQSRSSYPVSFEDENGFTVNTGANTKRWDLNHWLTLWGKVTPTLSLGPEVGQEQKGYNQSPSQGRFKSDLRTYKLGPSLRYQPLSGGLRFILSYEDSVDRDVNEAELGRFLPKNTQFALLSWISF